jgi:hypothetical protein
MGIRETWVFPAEGGEPFLKGTRVRETKSSGYMIMPDLPDFVSPIDGKQYSGRKGLREHCERHNVVPTADLKGLPPLPATGDTRSKQEIARSNAQRKEQIIHLVNKHVR